MDVVLQSKILEESVTEVALVEPKPDFSSATSILGSQLHHDKHTFAANTPKKHTSLDFKCLIDSKGKVKSAGPSVPSGRSLSRFL